MIICADKPLTIGEYRRGSLTDINCEWREDVPFVVLRETTEAEYRSYATEVGATFNPPFLRPMWFYVVSTD